MAESMTKARCGMMALGVCLLAATMIGCEGVMQDMYQQPKYRPLEPSQLFPDGRSARPPVQGTIARSFGGIADASSGEQGSASDLSEAPAPRIDRKLIEHGRERFDIYCSPCHGRTGDADGMVVQRGFPAPPSYHSTRLRDAPDGHFYEVITQGYGAMASYADRVSPPDRWAITAYIRVLQSSQRVPAAELTADERKRLEEPSR